MAKKRIPIKYTDRDFVSIKNALTDYAKRYYSNTFKDFSEASFGSLMLDSVAYVGDVLSFYLDYQANESFLHSAIEYDNIINLSREKGYKYKGPPSSHGVATFFVMAPANNSGGGPNTQYLPILLKGSEFSTVDGNNFILTESVHFNDANNEVVVGRVDETSGLPTYYAVKAFGQVISGQLSRDEVEVGEFQRFFKFKLAGKNIAEVISVVDSEGHQYFEVPYLSNNIIYRELNNTGTDQDKVRSILKPVVVPRRFVVEQFKNKTYLQFGYGSESQLTSDSVADPSKIVLDMHGKEHITDDSFDPAKLIATDKFGVAPSNTTLFVAYRENTTNSVNAAVDSLSNIVRPKFKFENITNLDNAIVRFIMSSLEVTNEKPITGDVTIQSSEELKRRALDVFATQNRAVTRQDYISTVYSMPPEFGAIKRCNIVQDKDSFKRNLNLYIISEGFNGGLITTSSLIKDNLKIWLNKNRMVHDTIDILDAKIINLGIDFTAIGTMHANKFDTLNESVLAIKQSLRLTPDIGEPFFLTDIHSVLRQVPGIVDVIDVKVVNKSGGLYSDVSIDVDGFLSPDGRFLSVEESIIWEIKFPNLDIRGTIKSVGSTTAATTRGDC